jgi:hypothetical protein
VRDSCEPADVEGIETHIWHIRQIPFYAVG